MLSLLVLGVFLAGSASGSVWPYHGSLALVQPVTGAIVASPLSATIVQPVTFANSEIVVSGPSSGTTIVKGSVAGPVTLTAASSAGSSEGSIAVVSPSVGSISTTEGGATAVIGPSSGPVVITGPKGGNDPLPVLAPKVIEISDPSLTAIGGTGNSIVVKAVTSGPTVVQGSTTGPVISQDVADNTVIVREPEVKVLTTGLAVAPASPNVTVSGPVAGKVAVSGPRAANAVVSGPSGTITTSR